MIQLPHKIWQRDWRWRWTKLGFGDTTIGSFGCTLSDLTMLLSVDDPRKTNDVLKAYAGYAGPNKNLIIWSRLPIAFQKIVSATRYFTYDNVKVKARLAKGTPVLVEVDGAKIGAARHWVLFVGDQQMWCPWLNKMLPTSYYPLVGFTDIATQ